jgi:hypothetical protein
MIQSGALEPELRFGSDLLLLLEAYGGTEVIP